MITAVLNRKLHAAAGELTDKKQAHETLHMIIEGHPYYKESVSELTELEGRQLLTAIETKVKELKKQVTNALGQPVLISEKQLRYAQDMFIELGWSEAYIVTLLHDRYQHEDGLTTLTSAKAVRLVAYLEGRIKSKRKKVA